MVTQLIKNKDPVTEVLDETCANHNIAQLSHTEWQKLKTLRNLLQPLEQASTELGGQSYVSSSILLPIMYHLVKLQVRMTQVT